MTVNGVKYGISILPENCLAYRQGYRYGAYQQNVPGGRTYVVEFFKGTAEIQPFVNANPLYGSEMGGGAE